MTRFICRMTKMSSYGHFTIYMLPSGEPFSLEGGVWLDTLEPVGVINDINLRFHAAAITNAAETVLRVAGYIEGDTATVTRAKLAACPDQCKCGICE